VKTCRAFVVLLGVLLLAAPARARDSEGPTARELLDGTDDMHRGESSHATVTMNVKTKRWSRSITMESWSEGEDKSLLVIRSPAKEAGMATLMVDDNIWNYLPRVDRTMKVPASLMGGSWMGSHFTNDDLVKDSRMTDDYTYELAERPTADGSGQYAVECVPKPDAPVVWGKVIVRLSVDEVPTEITYWDEKDRLKRTMTFSGYREIAGRLVARAMRLVPTDRPDEFTEVLYDEIEFDVELPPQTFTLQGLRH
jgi:hypothetical protein